MSVGHLDVFFGKMSIQIICPFFSRVVCVVFFFDVEMYELLHILDINPLSDTSFANIFSNSVGSHFILLIVSFAVVRCSLICLFLLCSPLPEDIYPKKNVTKTNVKGSMPTFSSRSFVASNLIFKS